MGTEPVTATAGTSHIRGPTGSEVRNVRAGAKQFFHAFVGRDVRPVLGRQVTGCAVAPMEYPDVSTNRLEREYDELPLLEPQIAERQPGLGPVGLGHGKSWPKLYQAGRVHARLARRPFRACWESGSADRLREGQQICCPPRNVGSHPKAPNGR